MTEHMAKFGGDRLSELRY